MTSNQITQFILFHYIILFTIDTNICFWVPAWEYDRFDFLWSAFGGFKYKQGFIPDIFDKFIPER